MKINNIRFETIVDLADFYQYISANKEVLGFDSDEFHKHCIDYMTDSGNLSSRYDKDWCRKVINKEDYANDKFWDKSRPYYPAILLFLEDYELEEIRFAIDF